MKRLCTFLLLALTLVLAGCQGRSLKDIKVTSARIVSIVPEGLTDLSALVEVGIHNPSVAFEVTDLIGLARFEGKDALSVTADQLIVAGHSDQLYQIPLKGHIEEGFNPFRLLRLLGSESSLDDVTVSFKGRVALRGGIGKNIEMEDIPLSTLINLPEQHEEEP
ncbi:MAG: hypothetical protein GXY24_01930 [Bacteroidales bacterium]|jgi:hypothetical protein|nr:hypothetical protein [Bacteroidales bacterium]